jgi:phytoene dehydrogenase-like protein
MSNDARYDCIVIGAGHNGLVCAASLARAGRRVLVLEAAAHIGGAAATREFAPGYRVSGAAHLLHLMPDALMRELQLEAHGLTWAARHMTTTLLTPHAAPTLLGEGLPSADSAAFADYQARMRRYAVTLAPLLARVPPRLGTSNWSDRLALLNMAWQVRKLGRRDMRDLLRIGGMNVYDLLQENFDSDALKGALGLDAVLGANFGPRSPGTVLTLLYRLAGEFAAGPAGAAAAAEGRSALSQPNGGMGALCDALAKAATAAGALVRTHSPVANVLVESDRAVGVQLADGERIGAAQVISNADPKTTFLKLVGTRHLDTGFVRRVNHIRCRGLAAKLHLALKAPPPFAAIRAAQLQGRLMLAPSLQYVEHAYNHAKYGEFSAAPVMEITVPSINDPSLAPAGHHVLSAVVQYAPYALKGGWDNGRPAFLDAALKSLETVAPGLRDSIVASEILTPLDIEREFRIHGGHWHHGDLAFDQFMMVRPVPGAAQYRTPLDGLYLCGAGCHPGGGVMGLAGRNAARQILEQQAAL